MEFPFIHVAFYLTVADHDRKEFSIEGPLTDDIPTLGQLGGLDIRTCAMSRRRHFTTCRESRSQVLRPRLKLH